MKTSSYVVCAVLALSLFALPVEGVNAESYEAIPNSEEVEIAKYFEITGTIHEISKQEHGYYATVYSKEDPFDVYFHDETVILDNTGKEIELKEGMTFKGYVDGSKPRIAIYPPRYSPDVIIVQSDELGTVKLDKFDEKYLNEDQDLIIHFGKDTVLTDLAGKEITKEEIINQNVLIFYDVVLESYPAQVYPSKIILLKKIDEKSNIEKAYRIAKEDYYIVGGVKMVPLRLIAEQLGYQVDSTGRGAIVTKGDVTFVITRGTTKYEWNHSVKTFAQAPALLEPRKTYVPYDFISQLVGEN